MVENLLIFSGKVATCLIDEDKQMGIIESVETWMMIDGK